MEKIQRRNQLVNAALVLAVEAHGDQVRKGNGNIPYVFHPIDVANEVILYSGLVGRELELASIIAILHDTVEDTDVTIAEIRERFGAEVACGVAFLTKDERVKKMGGDTKAVLLENLERLKSAPSYVQVVKLADRLANLKVFPAFWSREKVASYLDESVLIARELGIASEGLQARLLSNVHSCRVSLSIIP